MRALGSCLLGVLSVSVGLAAEPAVRLQFAPPGDRREIVVNPANDLVVPQVVDGDGWNTTFFLVNLDPTKEIRWLIRFYADDGQPLGVPLVGSDTPAMLVFASLPPRWSVSLSTQGTSTTLRQGWARVTTFDRPPLEPGAIPTTDRIGGSAVFRQRVPGRPDFEAVAPFSPINESRFVMSFDNRGGYSTGIAWLNPDLNSPAAVEVSIFDFESRLLRQEVFTLRPGSKLVFSMPERYPETIGRGGTIAVSTAAPLLSGLGLRFNPTGAFTSFHTLSVVP